MADDLLAALAALDDLPLDRVPAPAPLPRGSRMPLRPNPLFVGREGELRRLAAALKGGRAVAIGPAAAVTGMGGLGKTSLATEFAHRYGQFFVGGVFWVSCADASAVASELAACGGPLGLGLPGFAERPLDEQLAILRQLWQEPTPRLLIFDNCEDEAILQSYRPPSGGCRVLITSRRGRWSRALGVDSLALDVLPRSESIALLRRHRPDLAPADAGLAQLAEELGDLPLALHLAGSFLEIYADDPALGSPSHLLAGLREARLLAHPALEGTDATPSPTNHDLHVGRTFALSYERLDAADAVDALARRLLARAACLAPGAPFPRELLVATLELEEGDAAGQHQAARALTRLVGLGLLAGAGGAGLSLHRLLARFVQRLAPDAGAQAAVERVLRDRVAARRDAAGYYDDAGGALAALLPHLSHVALSDAPADMTVTAALASHVGSYLQQRADYGAARPLFEHALQSNQQTYGADHPETAISRNNLATLLYAQGEYAAARPLLEQVFRTFEQVLGPDDPGTVQSRNNLAMLLQALGEYAAARPLFEQALRTREQALGPDHPDTAQSRNNLAMLLYAQGEYAAARALLERALRTREQVLGTDHPDTALSRNNLAMLLQALGEYAAARPLLEQALQSLEQAYGPDHPFTATGRNNLAGLLQELGEHAAARPLFEQALRTREQALGPNHPDTAIDRHNLAMLLKELGEHAAARPLLEQALQSLEQALGPEHPSTKLARANLALLGVGERGHE